MRSGARRVLLLAGAQCLLAGSLGAGEDFKVIVHSSQPGTAIDRALLTRIYLGGASRWGDGTPVTPVDQSARLPVRSSFCVGGLGMPLGRVQSHWVDLVSTSRRRPPMVKRSDEEVIAFVGATRGAIGYVSAGAAIPDAVKVLAVVD